MKIHRNYLAFDIETAKIQGENETDWKACRPLGISCAATLTEDSQDLVLWESGTDAQSMTQQEASTLVKYLAAQVDDGYTIITWNGVGFDFAILAEESGMLEECQKLAVNHVDMMFHILCQLGYGVGLNAAAKGMKLAGKTEGMNGALAPRLWAEGKRDEVLEYVAQDVRTTLELARTCEACGVFRWIARSGKLRRMALPQGWLSVDLAEQLPQPDTSWMANPWSRATFTAWLGGSLAMAGA